MLTQRGSYSCQLQEYLTKFEQKFAKNEAFLSFKAFKPHCTTKFSRFFRQKPTVFRHTSGEISAKKFEPSK